MNLWISINSGIPKPIYQQIVDQISQAVAIGELSPGDKIPSVRRLASDITVNPNTVARAYTILEQKGIISTRKGSGTYISGLSIENSDITEVNHLSERLETWIQQAKTTGLSNDQIETLFKAKLQRSKRNKGDQ